MLPVIGAENLSTHHPIGPRERYKAFRDVITDALASPFRRFREHSQFAFRNSQCLSACLLVASRFTGSFRI